jgi:hypothetical protein
VLSDGELYRKWSARIYLGCFSCLCCLLRKKDGCYRMENGVRKVIWNILAAYVVYWSGSTSMIFSPIIDTPTLHRVFLPQNIPINVFVYIVSRTLYCLYPILIV